MDVGHYHVLKEKGAVSFTRIDDDEVSYCIKQYDNLTGEPLEDIVNTFTTEMIDNNIKSIDENLEYLNQSMKNLIMLKEDILKVKKED